LVLCNHVKSKQILRDLLDFLNDDDVGEIAAAGFDIVLRESEEVYGMLQITDIKHFIFRMLFMEFHISKAYNFTN